MCGICFSAMKSVNVGTTCMLAMTVLELLTSMTSVYALIFVVIV